MSDSGKGKFTTSISDDVLRQAMESVERHTGHAPAATQDEVVPVEVEQTAPAPTPEADAVAEVDAEQADPAASDPEAAQKELEMLRAQLELSMAKGRELMDKLKDQHEKMLRAAADLDNYKKRAAKEKEELQKFGAERMLKDFLPVIDNLDRALEHAKSQADYESLKTGVAMTRKQFEAALEKHGVKSFASHGQPFDPRLHEAMQQIETADLPPNHVALELVRGYTLNDRLIRPALVAVAKAPATSAPGPSENVTASGPSSPTQNDADGAEGAGSEKA